MGNEVSIPERSDLPNEVKENSQVTSKTDETVEKNDCIVKDDLDDESIAGNDDMHNANYDNPRKEVVLMNGFDHDAESGDWEELEEGVELNPLEIGEINVDNTRNISLYSNSSYNAEDHNLSPMKENQPQRSASKETTPPSLCVATPPTSPPMTSTYGIDDITPFSLDKPGRNVLATTRRLSLFVMIMFVIVQTLLMPGLKHFGIIEKEFVDSTVNRVIRIGPHLRSYQHSDDEQSSAASLSYMVMEEMRPGYQLAQQGAKAKYPIVMVPGFVTSGLEVWGGKKCAKQYFRQRFWTALTSARTFLLDTACWNEHMKLDPYTGGDPDGGNIRLRASEGFGAADYFLPFFWVWGKLIENLADVGYTPSTMTMEPYDWRLPFHILEERDGYFTKLRYKIELMHKTNGKKVVLATHSMGALVLHHFFTWVSRSEKEGGGGMDKNWVDDHIHTYITIAGCHLGVPKAATALLSGEMKDTVLMGAMGIMAEQFFGRWMRRELWSTFGSLWFMLPKGGEALWGPGSDMCMNSTANDPFCPSKKHEKASLILMADGAASNFTIGIQNASQSGTNLNVTLKEFVSKDKHSTTDVINFLQTYGSGLGPKTIAAKLSLHGKKRWRQFRHSIWNDPTRTALPYAPNMKIFCLYGTGLPTERAFYYKVNWESEASDGMKDNSMNHKISDPPIILDTVGQKDHQDSHGIRYSDGDGSVPLISLGYVCADAWKRDDSGLNPSGIPVYTREYKHEFKFTVDDPMRSGPSGSDHVDILGNAKMTEDFLRIVTDFGSDIVHSDHIVSDIKDISKEINKRGGVYKKWYLHRWQNLLIQLVLTDQQL